MDSRDDTARYKREHECACVRRAAGRWLVPGLVLVATLIPLACLAYLHWEDARVAEGEAPAQHWWNILLSGSLPAQPQPAIDGDRVYLPPGWDGGLLAADEHVGVAGSRKSSAPHLPVTELLHFLRQLAPAHFHHPATDPPAREAAPRLIQASN